MLFTHKGNKLFITLYLQKWQFFGRVWLLLNSFLNMAHSNVNHIFPPFIWLFVTLDSFIIMLIGVLMKMTNPHPKKIAMQQYLDNTPVKKLHMNLQ